MILTGTNHLLFGAKEIIGSCLQLPIPATGVVSGYRTFNKMIEYVIGNDNSPDSMELILTSGSLPAFNQVLNGFILVLSLLSFLQARSPRSHYG